MRTAHITRKGIPQQLYEPCRRWEMIGAGDIDILHAEGHALIPRTARDSDTFFQTQLETVSEQVAGDPVALGKISGFLNADAEALLSTAKQMVPNVTCVSPADDLISLYECYRGLVMVNVPQPNWQ